MKQTRARSHAFVLMEVVVGTMLLGLVSAGVYATMHLNETSRTHYMRQQQALQVLDNVVERLLVRENVTATAVKAVLDDEFRQSPLAAISAMESEAHEDAQRMVLTIRSTRHRVLARVIMRKGP